MQARQNRPVARRLADLDRIMLLAPVIGPEHMQPPGLGRLQRHAGRDDGIQHMRRSQQRGKRAAVQQRQSLRSCNRGGIRHRQDNRRRKQPRRLQQRNRRPVQIGRPIAQRPERPLHRCGQVARRVCHRLHPVQPGIVRHRDPRQIAVIGPCLQRLRPPAGDRQHRRSPSRAAPSSRAADSVSAGTARIASSRPVRATGTPMRRSARARFRRSARLGPRGGSGIMGQVFLPSHIAAGDGN